MKIQKWTLALAAAGLVCNGSQSNAEETLHPVLTQVSQTTLSGFVDTSAIWQFGDHHTDVARYGDGSDRQDGFNLNQIGIILSKPLTDEPWSAGYKVELLDGADVGNELTLHNAFVKLGAPIGNGLVLKAGIFSSLAGYEYIERYKNPNFSHSYGYYTEPGRQTGLVADYKICEGVNVTAGIANVYGPGVPGVRATSIRNGVAGIDESNKNVMGAISLDAPESFGPLKGANLYMSIIHGRTHREVTQSMVNGGFPGSVGAPLQGNDLTDFTAVLTLPTPIKNLTTVLTYDYVTQDGNNPSYPGYRGENHANATAMYLIYKATDKLTFANRLDYANGTSGYFDTFGPAHTSDKLLADTFTISYSLWANVLTRAEFRWDHDLAGRTFGGGTEKDAFSLGMNVVYQF